MQSLQQQIKVYEEEIQAFQPQNAQELEAYRIKFLGTKGIVKQIFGEMKNVPGDQKKEAGQLLNAFKQLAEEKWELNKHLQDGGNKKDNNIDLSLPGSQVPMGTRHPLRMVENKMVSIFEKLGFSVASGPEIEDDWHNFEIGSTRLNSSHSRASRMPSSA